MIRRVFLAFLVFGLVACGDNGTDPDRILGTYTLQTINGEEFLGFSRLSNNAFGGFDVIQVTAAHTVLGPQDSCEASWTETTSVFDANGFLLGTSTMTLPNPCTFEFSDGALTLNYTDGRVETGSIVGSTLTITRNGDVWVFRK